MQQPQVPAAAKWFSLIQHIREESESFNQILKAGSEQRAQSNLEYKKQSQISFNMIHNVKRSSPAQSPNRVPYLSRSANISPKKNQEKQIKKPQKYGPMEFEMPVTNSSKWPKRKSCAQRILNPIHLKDYPDMTRPKDDYVVMGDVLPSYSPESTIKTKTFT
ncbi:hypothetical protein TVAG_318650 [Trichomonas vaginalis G3]|uniref:Uncharacterized protein n=1 Tax=Trichomonas vaginalis (strain ATCC PRA-98 / G3) TaxID=412133 RepID=A2G5L5_TRIV3|nr:hypothetical protein TVAG_318650 [Trichomonas vaginalis G3]|eukprot:XP_001300480.1 hypothetical protein [Trichomonas vaginalis G3]